MLGQAEEAFAAAEEALALSQKANPSNETISILNLLCEIHADLLDQYEKAVQNKGEALKIARKM